MKHLAQAFEHQKTPPFPIALVVSQFNRDVTQALQDGAVSCLLEHGFSTENITIIEVPGAVEIPLVVQRLAKAERHAVVIALGAVIRGETSHYDLVCESVSEGCQQVALKFDIPVIFGVLTTEDEAQAWDRLGGKHGHKGIDAAKAAMAMYRILQQLSS